MKFANSVICNAAWTAELRVGLARYRSEAALNNCLAETRALLHKASQ